MTNINLLVLQNLNPLLEIDSSTIIDHIKSTVVKNMNAIQSPTKKLSSIGNEISPTIKDPNNNIIPVTKKIDDSGLVKSSISKVSDHLNDSGTNIVNSTNNMINKFRG